MNLGSPPSKDAIATTENPTSTSIWSQKTWLIPCFLEDPFEDLKKSTRKLGFFVGGWFFTDCSMVNHHETTIWDNILRIFPSIEESQIQKNLPILLLAWRWPVWPQEEVGTSPFARKNPLKKSLKLQPLQELLPEGRSFESLGRPNEVKVAFQRLVRQHDLAAWR